MRRRLSTRQRVALGLALACAALWLASTLWYVELYHRKTRPHIRTFTLLMGGLWIHFSGPTASSECPWLIHVSCEEAPGRHLLWIPRARSSTWIGDAAYTSVCLPLWIPTAAAILGMVPSPGRRRPGVCPECRYNLRGLPEGAPCPECGGR